MKVQAVDRTIDEALVAELSQRDNVPQGDEYKKMVSGMPYDASEPALFQGRRRAACLAYDYNRLDPRTDDYDAKTETMVREIFGRVGKNPTVIAPFHIDYGCNTSLGDNFYANFNMTILDVSSVTIGNDVLFGPNVYIYSAGHDTSILSRVKDLEWGLPVTIGDNCWVGGNTVILAGVTIGKGCTIGAGSVVSKDIPPYSVAVGSPAKVIRKVQTLEEELADPNNPYNRL